MLLPLVRHCAWWLPLTIVLGIVSSLAESVGLSLFVPLLQSLDQDPNRFGGDDNLQRILHFILRRAPAGHPLPYIVGLILAMSAAKAVLTYAHSILAARINSSATHRLRSRLFDRLTSIGQQTLDKVGAGRLVNLLATDTWHTGDAISLSIDLVSGLCSILVFSALLVALSWKLTVVVVVGVLLVSTVLRALTARARRLGQEGVRANAVLSAHMLDALEGLREIQLFGLKRRRQELFDGVSERVRSVYCRLDLLHRAVSPLSEVLYVGLLLGLLTIGVAGRDSANSVIVFLLVLYRLQPHIRQVDSARLSLVALTTSVEDVTSFLEPAAPATPAPSRSRLGTARPASASISEPRLSVSEPRPLGSGLHSQCALGEALEFSRVSFSYTSGREPALQDVSFRVPCGKTTAIVGPSGSGKSTLISLLCRFYEPESGTIRVDGRALSSVDVESWRSRIAWVSQDAYIFAATVRENIRYGRMEATDDEVFEAAMQADADAFIQQLPDGFETRIGRGGEQLSSGQVQRIALARAFLRRADLLILDEATNSLDSISEAAIRAGMRQSAGGQTVIVVSHRLSTVRHADHVVVLSDGKVLEEGRPGELVARRGLFFQLRELQHVE
jgi:ABC-type multidrug transport system fused ATPase/permease subunit